MNSPQPEFKVGDIVHWRGSHDHPVAGYPATIRGVYLGMFSGRYPNGDTDDRIFYYLRGDCDYSTRATRDATANVVVHTTGQCIVESSLYVPPSDRD